MRTNKRITRGINTKNQNDKERNYEKLSWFGGLRGRFAKKQIKGLSEVSTLKIKTREITRKFRGFEVLEDDSRKMCVCGGDFQNVIRKPYGMVVVNVFLHEINRQYKILIEKEFFRNRMK